MIVDDLSSTLQVWIDSLDEYDEQKLAIKLDDFSWSIGQVYQHLINETNFFIAQVRICLSTNNDAHQIASPHGVQMLADNEFPDERIEGPPSNAFLKQPCNKEEILIALKNLQAEIEATKQLFEHKIFSGKTKHPGLLYLNAYQWCQFAEMHLRHHLRQKGRIDEYLTAHDILS